MMLGSPDQHRVGVTRLLASERAPRPPQRLESGASLQRVVDNFALGPHEQQRTWSRPRRRPTVIFRKSPLSGNFRLALNVGPAFLRSARERFENWSGLVLWRTIVGRPDRFRGMGLG